MKTVILCLLTVLGGTNLQASDDEQKTTHDQIVLYAQLLTAAAVGAATVSAKHVIASIPDRGQAMLLAAAATNDIRKTDWLLWLGVDPNKKENKHGFALHNAVYYDHEEMVQLLVHHGATEQFYDYNFAVKKSALYHTARVQGQFTLEGDKAGVFYKWTLPSHYSPSMLYLLLTLYKEKRLPLKFPALMAHQIYEWALQEKLDQKADADRKLDPKQLALQEIPLFPYLKKETVAHQLTYADPRTYR